MSDSRESADNLVLASSCGEKKAACCKDGYIFLPRMECQRILDYLADKPDQLQEFKARLADHGDFYLYDQQTRCQFLQEDERCELHAKGLKPTECFWWPAHVYLADDGSLEIRVATCCSGCSHLTPECSHVEVVTEQARKIGLPLLTNFRKVHSYGKDYRVVAKL
jgi:hypothetical protein